MYKIISPAMLFAVCKMNSGKISEEEALKIYDEQACYPSIRETWEKYSDILNEIIIKRLNDAYSDCKGCPFDHVCENGDSDCIWEMIGMDI